MRRFPLGYFGDDPLQMATRQFAQQQIQQQQAAAPAPTPSANDDLAATMAAIANIRATGGVGQARVAIASTPEAKADLARAEAERYAALTALQKAQQEAAAMAASPMGRTGMIAAAVVGGGALLYFLMKRKRS